MAMASGIGATVNQLDGARPDPASSSARTRAAISSPSTARASSTAFCDEAERAGIFAPWIGTTGGAELKLGECACDTGCRTEGSAMKPGSRASWRQAERRTVRHGDGCAARSRQLIKDGIPDAKVTIRDLAGDGDHYAAEVVAESFPRQEPRAAAPDGLRGAEGQHGRRAARAGAADQRAGVSMSDRMQVVVIDSSGRRRKRRCSEILKKASVEPD